MAQGVATVKAVLSGDTLLLMGRAKGGPPPEIKLNLSSLEAPRLGRAEIGKPDAPWAFKSREFLRKMAIGKQVRFKVDYAVPSIKRQWATVKIGQLDLGAEMVKQGWAAVKDPASSRDGCSPNVEDYLRLEDAAQAERLGMWGEKNAKTNEIRAREQTIDDAEAFVASVKDQPLPAVVEWVRDGTTCKCYIPSKNVSVLVQSAGIQAPKMRPRRTAANGGGAAAVAAPAPPASPSTDAADGDAADGDAAPSSPQAPAPEPILPPEPFAAEAKHFLEVRMLHRDICVRLHSADRNNSFFGTLEHPNGDIRALMVRQGLARVVDWSIEYLPRDKKLQLRECEQLAKTAKARLWNSYVAPDLSGGGPAQFVGTVGEVSSGDTLVILAGGEDAAGNEAGAPPAPGARDARRISLSSVRVPRMGGRNATPEPYALQSKEFLRKMLIGKRVRVSVEYSRASPARADGDQRPALPARYFASVFLERGGNSKNVAEALLLAGLGEAVRHRSGDERSAHYDALLDAQAAAKARAKGIHSSSEGGEATQRIKDVTGGRGAGGVSATAAQQFVKMLKTGKTHKAIVEYIHNAGRFKLYIPKENCRINFQLAGLRVPATPRRALAASSDGRAGREATPGEPFGLEALAYVRENVMQRSVEVEIEDVNRSGCAIGVLRTYRGGERYLLAATLLSQGYAEVVPFSAAKSSSRAELEIAEEEGRAAERGLWNGWEEREKVRAATEAAEETANAAKMNALSVTKDVAVSHIVDGGLLWVRYKTDASETEDGAKVAAITARIAADVKGATPPAPLANPKKFDFCLAPFDDGQGEEFFRARIESLDGGQAEVLFLDHGNTARVPVGKLLPCDAEVLAIPPLAHRLRLAFVRAPGVDEEFGNAAGNMLADLVWGLDCQAKVHWQENDGTLVASLYAGKEDIAALAEMPAAADASTTAAQAVEEEPAAMTADAAPTLAEAAAAAAAGGGANQKKKVQQQKKKVTAAKVEVYTVAEKMLQKGFVRIQKGAARDATNGESRAVLRKMVASQESARQSRVGMWRYGDADSDDETDGRGRP